MDKGVLLFAFANEQINYIKQAEECARRIKKYLDVPVALVTDSDIKSESFVNVINYQEKNTFSKRIYSNGSKATNTLTFRNTARSKAYDLTPFDTTLVMDVDYMLCSDTLKHSFELDRQFQIYKDAVDIHPDRDRDEFTYTSSIGPMFYWATVFCFQKTKEVKQFFDLLNVIQNNYRYYVDQYKFKNDMFRNDYLFSIALNLLDNNFADILPGKMYYSLDKDTPILLSDTEFKAITSAKRIKIPVRLENCDIHVMNKYWLEEYL